MDDVISVVQGGPDEGILEIAPYAGTGSSESTRALATSVSVSENAQKNLGESTHPIGSTRSMHINMPSSPDADGMTYANAPTCAGLTVPQWYASVTSSFYTLTGPWIGSASHTACSMRGKARPNCSNSAAASLSVVSLTLSVFESGCADRLRIRRGRRCA